MKLEPVYLLAPEPDTRIKLSRRAFFGVLLASGAICGAGGYGLGRRGSETRTTPAPEHANGESVSQNRSSKQFVWARATASGPIEELVKNAHGFIVVVSSHPKSAELWEGIARLADHLVDDHSRAVAGQARTLPVDDDRIATLILDLMNRVRPPEDLRRFKLRRVELERIVK